MIHILMILYPIYMLLGLWKHGVMVARISVYKGLISFIELQGSETKKQGIIPAESLSTLNTDIAKVSSH